MGCSCREERSEEAGLEYCLIDDEMFGKFEALVEGSVQ